MFFRGHPFHQFRRRHSPPRSSWPCCACVRLGVSAHRARATLGCGAALVNPVVGREHPVSDSTEGGQ
jgi:hypothetical protein